VTQSVGYLKFVKKKVSMRAWVTHSIGIFKLLCIGSLNLSVSLEKL